MERKKLVLLIAGGIVALLFAVVILLASLNRADSATPEPTAPVTLPPEEQPEPEATFIDEPLRDGMLVNPSGDPEGPPSEAYLNDYSEDDGYDLLPENYDGERAPEGTVYDAQWMLLKYYDLECELSTKRSVTERAITPMKNFISDLMLVESRHENATDLRVSMAATVAKYEARMEQRAPEEYRQLLSQSCNIEENQPGHLHEDGEDDEAHDDIPDVNPADYGITPEQMEEIMNAGTTP